MTNALLAYKEEFDDRHAEDDQEDLATLQERWPSVKFHNIPVAWIVILDTMLCRMRYSNPVREVRQEFGQLIVIHGPLRASQEKIIREAEQEIYAIDADLKIEHTDEKAETSN